MSPDAADRSGRTPFSWAAESGNGEIVRMLLERNDVNPHTADEGGRTPFLWTAGLGIVSPGAAERCEGVLKILLEQNDVNLGSADKCGRTLLS